MVRRIGVLAMTALLVTGTASAQLASEGGPIQVNADNSEVRERQREVIVTGNVDIVQGMARLRANRVTLNYTSNSDSTRSQGIGGGFGDISSMRAVGDVFYVTPDLKARGDDGVYDAATEIITMTGNVILNRGEDVARGCELKLNVALSTSVLKGCDGRVQMVIFPKDEEDTDDDASPAETPEDTTPETDG